MTKKRPDFEIGFSSVPAGTRETVEVPVSVLSDHTPVTLSVHVVHGKKPGPVLFVSAAIHGDEVIGVEIARRLLRSAKLKNMSGTLMVIPIVNAFGFLSRSRYLPDRRDLNRSFPGSENGSLASRLAHIFMNEVVLRADFGIDLHSAAIHRTNLPQIRVSAANEATLAHAQVFGAPVTIVSKLRDGSLRGVASEKGIDMLLYEAGEGLRFDEFSGRVGLHGILRVMHGMGMISEKGVPKLRTPSMIAASSSWARAPEGGLLRSFRKPGDIVQEDMLLGIISDPFGERDTEVTAPQAGVLIGRTNLPIVNEGDGIYHIARIEDMTVASAAEVMAAHADDAPMADEDEIL